MCIMELPLLSDFFLLTVQGVDLWVVDFPTFVTEIAHVSIVIGLIAEAFLVIVMLYNRLNVAKNIS